jgi:hypothetical protein
MSPDVIRLSDAVRKLQCSMYNGKMSFLVPMCLTAVCKSVCLLPGQA